MSNFAVKTISGIRRALRRRVPLQGPGEGFTTEADGFEVSDIRVEVDLAEVARIYGPQAMGNRSGRSKFMGGCVVIEVKSRERVKS